MSSNPLLMIVSSPSGAGKTSLTSALRSHLAKVAFSVSHTTRPPRLNERDGREYHFVTRQRFKALVEENAFLEWAEVHDNWYGTSYGEVERAADARCLLFDVDHQGARQIKSNRPDAVGVFILPPSMELLEQRLRGRASEDEASLKARFERARAEIAHYGLFDYVLVNDVFETALEQLKAILLAEECRRNRAARLAERLLGRPVLDT
jgi:guanylate kinase